METPAVRSKTMRAVTSKDTGPELIVRRLLHSLGYRYRLHGSALPGKPDLVFSARRKVIFVHGCFWHGHACLRGARVPKTNTGYWVEKIERNRKRDDRSLEELSKLEWDALVVWECEIRATDELSMKLTQFLG